MTIADKISRAREDYDAVYSAGYEKGKAEGGGGGSYDQGYADGKKAEYDLFWDNFQQNGNCRNYESAFRGNLFGDAIYSPKYDIIASALTGANYLFMNNKQITDTKVKISVPQAGEAMVFYQASNLKRIPALEISNKTTFSNWFAGCSALEELNIIGEIAQNDFDVKWSTKLSRNSIVSVVNALSDAASGMTVTLSETAVENAFENKSTEILCGLTSAQEDANVMVVDNGDGTITLNGTVETDTCFRTGNPTDTFSAGTYTLSLPHTKYGVFYITLYDSEGKAMAGYDEWSNGEAVTFTANTDFTVTAWLYVMGAETFDNVVMALPAIILNEWDTLAATKPNWTIALA